MTENEAVVRRFLNLMFEGNSDLLAEVYDENAVWHGGCLGEAHSLDGYIALSGHLKTGITLTGQKVEDVIAVGDKVVARITSSGVHDGEFLGYMGTGKPFEYSLTNTYRLANGKIVEDWHSGDYLGLLQQTGAIPRHT